MSVSKKTKTSYRSAKAHFVHQDVSLLRAFARPIEIKPHHHKPFRIRHIGWLTVALLAFFALTLETGLVLGRDKVASPVTSPVLTTQFPERRLTTVRSSYGFSFTFDSNQFMATASAVASNGKSFDLTQDQLPENKDVSLVMLRPVGDQVPTHLAPTRLSMQVANSTSFVTLKRDPRYIGKSDGAIAAAQFAVPSAADFDVFQTASSSDTLSGVPVQKTTYQYVPKFNAGPSYTVEWTGVINDHAFMVRLQGLIGSSGVPDVYQGIFNSLALNSTQKVAGVSTLLNPTAAAEAKRVFNDKYQADLISPAVVKIYHLTCGVLTVSGKALTDDTCDGSSGSGFLVSSDGYIATNGHVVVYTAKDAFAAMLLHNPEIFAAFLRGAGLNNTQISLVASRPDLQAAILAKIYDLSDEDIKLANAREATFVAIGSEPLSFATADDVKKALDRTDTALIKHADVVATNYASKDLYTLQSGDNKGFSASDVALLKISIKNAPYIAVNSAAVTQNQKISLLGFPGDAENQLVSRDTLSVSVTNGAISSIREAAGNSGKLYQSDVDASHGNSGGPAVDDTGAAIGLLTYRFTTTDSANAAKSYIRDIADFNKLARDKRISFNTDSTTQAAWRQGLELMAANHYSSALKQFAKVKKSYPAHRLADSYMDAARQAIKDGKDVRDVPVGLLLFGIFLSLAAAAAAIIAIIRHHARHQLYKAGHTGTNAVPAEEHLLTTTQAKAQMHTKAATTKPDQV